MEFQVGDVVQCVASRGYAFTTGQKYTILKYEPKYAEPTFTWPPYVVVEDDYGKKAHCHADRFVKP